MKIQFSAEALGQLDDVFNSIRRHNATAAVRIKNELLGDIVLLENHPQLGYVEPLLKNIPKVEYRSLLTSRWYKVVYVVNGENISVVAIFDCRRDPAKLKESVLT